MARALRIEIIADTRKLRQSLIDAQLLMPHVSLRRRLALRFAQWRISREDAP